MAYIKWRKSKPFVYKSERVTEFRIVDYEVVERRLVKSVYLGTYESYRSNRPNGAWTDMMKPEARLKMLATPERANLLTSIDEAAHTT